jgi:hypothetical protein
VFRQTRTSPPRQSPVISPSQYLFAATHLPVLPVVLRRGGVLVSILCHSVPPVPTKIFNLALHLLNKTVVSAHSVSAPTASLIPVPRPVPASFSALQSVFPLHHDYLAHLSHTPPPALYPIETPQYARPNSHFVIRNLCIMSRMQLRDTISSRRPSIFLRRRRQGRCARLEFG